MKRQAIMDIHEIHYFLAVAVVFCVLSCHQKKKEKEPVRTVDYIKKIEGPSGTIPLGTAQKGEVLIAYSDCYTCHAIDKRSKGPAFKDIAIRYPVQKAYIDPLAYKIIKGGFGSWGNPVMSPHPNISIEDARLMAAYILSLKEK
jgi:cytochrome c